MNNHITQLKNSIAEITPEELLSQKKKFTLVDIREDSEKESGIPEGAISIKRGFLELEIEKFAKHPSEPIAVFCGAGVRSLYAAKALQDMGYTEVYSVKGGTNRWKELSYPLDFPISTDGVDMARYARHISLQEIGIEGQKKLSQSSVTIVGAGGLASSTAYYLAAAGIGELILIDGDKVESSNLQRQIIHEESTIGIPKVHSASQKLKKLNSNIKITTHNNFLTSKNLNLLSTGNIVIEASDNLKSKYAVNQYCKNNGIAVVQASVFKFQGQITTVDSHHEAPCYACLFPDEDMSPPKCSEVGVLGAVPGALGILQALEAIKVLLNIGEPLVGTLLTYDALNTEFQKVRYSKDPHCKVCGS